MSLKGRNVITSSKGKQFQSEHYPRKSGGTRTRPLKRLNMHRSSSTETDSEVDQNDKKNSKCQSRNAVMARMNRIKKKQYLQSIEKDLAHYKSECESMRGTLSMQTKMVQTLRNEVLYLKNVLANSKEISVLLKSVRSSGLPVTSSLKPTVKVEAGLPSINKLKVEPEDEAVLMDRDVDLSSVALPIEEDDCLIPSPSSDLGLTDLLGDLSGDDLFNAAELSCNVGICLHLAHQRVSLEFCSLCNSKAAMAWDNTS